MAEERGRPGCFTWFLAGCGCLVLLVLVALGAVALNLDRIMDSSLGRKMRQAVQTVSDEVRDAGVVREALAARFPEDHVSVEVHYRHPGREKILTIRMAREVAEIPEARTLEERARQAALAARNAYPRPETLTAIVVRFELTGSGKIRTHLSQDYTFPMDALEEP